MLSKIINKFKYYCFRPIKYAKSIGVTVGNNTKIMTKLFGTEPYLISIGDNCEITADVSFVTHDGGVWILRNKFEKYKRIDIVKPIKLHNNIYIGNSSIILPGVEIVDDVVIGAGSIVTKSITNSGVYAGIPCKFICSIEKYIEKNSRFFENTKNLSIIEKKEFYLRKYS